MLPAWVFLKGLSLVEGVESMLFVELLLGFLWFFFRLKAHRSRLGGESSAVKEYGSTSISSSSEESSDSRMVRCVRSCCPLQFLAELLAADFRFWNLGGALVRSCGEQAFLPAICFAEPLLPEDLPSLSLK